MRSLLMLVVGACVLAGGPDRMESQEQDSANDYDARALRVENRFGNRVLLRGREGTLVTKIGDGFRAPDVGATVASSPEALREATDFRQRYNRGTAMLTVGGLVLGVAVGFARDGLDGNAVVPAYGVIAASSLLATYGAIQLGKAYSALARSIWWYNRELRR